MQRFHPLHPPQDGLPPKEVRFSELRVEPWPEGDKIRVHAQITPFTKPPDLELVLFDASGNELSIVNVVENIDFSLVFTMHIRNPSADRNYTLTAKISYEDIGIVDESSTTFVIPTESD